MYVVILGVVLAKLPFTPMPLFRGMTHRGLEGEDFTDCGMHLIYILSSMVLRSSVARIFGFQPKIPQQNPFTQLQEQYPEYKL